MSDIYTKDFEDVTDEITSDDSIIWQNNFLPGRDEAAENVDTKVHKCKHRDIEFLIKRRNLDSDKQMLTEIVVRDEELWGGDTGERCILKYGGRRFDDNEVRQVIKTYTIGRQHQAEKFRNIHGIE